MDKTKKPKRVKIGKCWYVCGYDGKPIIGLSWDQASGYYYPTHYKQTNDYKKTGKRPHFGKDYDNAIHLFNLWIQRDKHQIDVGFSVKKKLSPKDTEFFKRFANQIGIDEEEAITELEFETNIEGADDYKSDPSYEVSPIVELSEDIIIQKTKELFGKYSPPILAEKLGIPSLAKIDYSDEVRLPLKLTEIFDKYINQAKFTEEIGSETEKELSKVKMAWSEFVIITKTKYLNEITREILDKYYNNIYKRYKSEDHSSSWINGRFERIKRIFNYALKQYDDTDLFKVKNRLSAILRSEKKINKYPAKLIEKEDFHKILSISTIEEKALWLLSLNAAYYSVDISELKKSSINFKSNTIIYRRTKTEEKRSCCLWQNTIDAIYTYWGNNHQNIETVFCNLQENEPYNKYRIPKKFRSCLEKAGLKGKYRHDNFRDSFTSVCQISKVPYTSIDCVLGHKLQGQRGTYSDPELNPLMAEEACKAVYQYYFGND